MVNEAGRRQAKDVHDADQLDQSFATFGVMSSFQRFGVVQRCLEYR